MSYETLVRSGCEVDTNTEFEVVIKDFGTNWEEAGQTLKEKDHFLTAVISENLWEYGKAKMMLEKMTGSKEENMGRWLLSGGMPGERRIKI